MQFKEVIGQAVVKAKLIQLANSDKIPHAMMFLGPEGNGSLVLALALAQYILCEHRQEGDSCGVCPSCTKNKNFVHPDVHYTFPVIKPEKKKDPPVSADFIKEWRSALMHNPYMSYNDWLQTIGAENKLGNITADECRQIIHQLQLKTYEGGHKVQLIWLAEYLGYEGNILLKILEEPPMNTLFILIAENSEMLLNTILSRTQLIKVNQVNDLDIQHALLQRFEMDAETAIRIARICDGNVNAALHYADGDNNNNETLLHRWLVCCFNLRLKNSSTNVVNLQEWIENIAKIGRENQKLFLKYGLFFLRECSLIAAGCESEKLEGDELKFAKGLASKLDPMQVASINDIFNHMYYHIDRNANPKVLFTSNSFKIARIFAKQELMEEVWNM